MVLKTSVSSRGCPLYWKLALENVVPKATGSSQKFRPDVWRLVVKVVDESSKFVVQTFLFSTHFQRLIVFQQRTKGQNCKFFTRKSQKRLEQKQNQINLLFDFPHRDSGHSLTHKLEYARTGDLFFRLFLRDTFRATNW